MEGFLNFVTNQKPTDDDLAKIWRRKHQDVAFGLGKYRKYNNGVWVTISEDAVKQEVMATLVAAKSTGIRPTKSLLNSVMEIVRVLVFVEDEKWDADPDILVVTNGTLRLSSLDLSEHSPKHYVTAGLPYPFDPSVEAPNWLRFVQMLDGEIAEFVQEHLGYSLTTEMKHEIALWFVGPPGSGKSTCIMAYEIAGGHKVVTLGLGDIERSRFALTNIIGKTIAISPEQPTGRISTSHLLNALISGERVSIDRKFLQPIEYFPKLKLVWALNDLPSLPPGDNGLFRRIRIVPFGPIPDDQRDPDLKNRISQEGPGILNWALEGLNRLRTRGKFEIPPIVQLATEEFRRSSDVPGIFLSECAILDRTLSTQAQELYSAYDAWCYRTGHRPKSKTEMAQEWNRLGLVRYSGNGRHFYRGVGLKSGSRFGE